MGIKDSLLYLREWRYTGLIDPSSSGAARMQAQGFCEHRVLPPSRQTEAAVLRCTEHQFTHFLPFLPSPPAT